MLAVKDLDHILDYTQNLWDELRGERIFITGGTGFFGCWLLESFNWANERLRLGASALVLTRDQEAFLRKAPWLRAHPAIQFHQGDVRSFEFPAGLFSHIIHAATESSTRPSVSDSLPLFDTIVEGTRHTLEFSHKCGAKKFLLTSSGAIYGKQPKELTHIPEEYMGSLDPIDPLSAYGEGKRSAEMLCALYSGQYGFETKIARCFAFVGPYLPLDAHFAIGNFIRDGLKGGPIIVKGDGTPYRSYLYAADLAIWLWTILIQGKSLYPYNVGSESAINVKTLAETVARSFQPSPEVRILRQVVPGSLPEKYVPLTRRAASELKLQQTIDLNDSIERTIDWHKKIEISHV